MASTPSSALLRKGKKPRTAIQSMVTPFTARAIRTFRMGAYCTWRRQVCVHVRAKEHEWGIDYLRIYDPDTNEFKPVLDYRMRFEDHGTQRQASLDGRVLVTGAFTDYSTDHCLGAACYNPQLNVFDPKSTMRGENPWTVWLDKEHADADINPGIREYTRLFMLPEPVTYDGTAYSILAMGKSGVVVLINDDDEAPMDKRLYKPKGGKRPGNCGDSSDQSTAVPLLQNGGELMVMGGCTADSDTMQRIDVYNVQKDEWKSVDTGIQRGVPASVLLPDGKVLLLVAKIHLWTKSASTRGMAQWILGTLKYSIQRQ